MPYVLGLNDWQSSGMGSVQLQRFHQFVVNRNVVAGQHVGYLDIEVGSTDCRDLPAGFADGDNTRGLVPGFERSRPVGVQSAASDVRQVQRCGSGSLDAASFREDV